MNAELTIPLWIWLCDALLTLTPFAAEHISRYWVRKFKKLFHKMLGLGFYSK
jgi:hypothetical protein